MVSVKHLYAYQVYDRILSYLWIGPEMFGFTNPDIITAIEDLQGADEWCGYIPYYERSMKVYYKDTPENVDSNMDDNIVSVKSTEARRNVCREKLEYRVE